MRHINFFYVEKIPQKQLSTERKRWVEANFEFAPFHYMLSFDGFDEVVESPSLNDLLITGRPLNMNNGLFRDAFISKKGIGILVVLPDHIEEMTDFMFDKVGELIKNVSMDLGIEEHQLVTNFYENDKKVDTIKINYAIKEAKDKFLKIRT